MDKKSVSVYQRGVRMRTKYVREMMGWTQQEAADALGLALHTYRKYELRSVMPAHYMVKFTQITGYPLDYLLTGAITQLPRESAGAEKRQA